MKNYGGILILEPEDSYLSLGSSGESLSIRGGSKPLYSAIMAIAKKSDGKLVCLKSKEKLKGDYTQAELQEIVDICENGFDLRLLFML